MNKLKEALQLLSDINAAFRFSDTSSHGNLLALLKAAEEEWRAAEIKLADRHEWIQVAQKNCEELAILQEAYRRMSLSWIGCPETGVRYCKDGNCGQCAQEFFLQCAKTALSLPGTKSIITGADPGENIVVCQSTEPANYDGCSEKHYAEQQLI